MKSDATFIRFEPRPTKAGSFGLLPNSETLGPITPAAWEASFTAALPLIKAMLRRTLRDEADVLEAVQQTALKATACQRQFRAEASLSTWLVSIALNEARQILRKQNRQRVTVSLDFLGRDLWDQHTASPEEAAHRAERQAWMHQAVGKLSSIDQTIVRLCEFEEHSIEQAAQLLQMTPAAVKSRRFRARHLLAERFFKQHGRVNDSAASTRNSRINNEITTHQ